MRSKFLPDAIAKELGIEESQSLLNEVKVSTLERQGWGSTEVAIPFKWGQSFYGIKAGINLSIIGRNPF